MENSSNCGIFRKYLVNFGVIRANFTEIYLSFCAFILSKSIFVNTNKKQKAKFDFWNLLFQFPSANDQILKNRSYRVKCNFRNAPFRTTILVLGSMLDTFQKIADAASNTRGKKFTPFLSWSLYVVFTTFGRGFGLLSSLVSLMKIGGCQTTSSLWRLI